MSNTNVEKYKKKSTPELREDLARRDARAAKERAEAAKESEEMGVSAARTVSNFGYSLLTGVLFTVAPSAEAFGGTPVGTDEVAAIGGGAMAYFADGVVGGIGSGIFQAGTSQAGRKLGKMLGAALFS